MSKHKTPAHARFGFALGWQNVLAAMHEEPKAPIVAVGDGFYIGAARIDPRSVKALSAKGLLEQVPGMQAWRVSAKGEKHYARMIAQAGKRANGSSAPAQAPSQRTNGASSTNEHDGTLAALVRALNEQNQLLSDIRTGQRDVATAIRILAIDTAAGNELLARLVQAWEGNDNAA